MTSECLCGGFPTDLFFDFPVREQILMAAPRALPRTFHRIGAAFVEHFHDEMAMQTHGRMTVDPFCFCGFGHYCHINLLLSYWLRPFSDFGIRLIERLLTYNYLPHKSCSRSYTDGESKRWYSRRLSEIRSQNRAYYSQIERNRQWLIKSRCG